MKRYTALKIEQITKKILFDENLAEQFNVSKQAMKIRLEELHLAHTKDMITFYRSKLEMAEILSGQQKLFF